MKKAAVLLGVAWLALSARAATLTALVVDDESAATAAVERAGGRVAHRFDSLWLVELPDRGVRRIVRLPGVREVAERGLPAGRASGRTETFRAGLTAWNARGTRRAAPSGPLPEFEGNDAFLPPATLGPTVLPLAGDDSHPYGAQPENTSEFLAGKISVNVFLHESDGTIDAQTENWSAEREAAVVERIVAGLDWLRVQEPLAHLEFVYHVYPGRTDSRARTGYEPIRRAADPKGTTGEALWVGAILAKFGYASGDRIARSRAMADATRLADGTDWTVNVFVADSYADVDGRFADGYFAYAWIGGPHVVMTYDDATWGVARMDLVLRHEFLHAFWAFDEYASSGCNCAESRGYLDGRDGNCDACNAAAVPCVMISNGDALCDHTRRQIGWADLDGDGLPDPVGEDPDSFPDPVAGPRCGPFALEGSATVVAATNRNPVTTTPRASISLARIAGVDARVGTGAWTAAAASDGAFGDPVERFSAEVPEGAGPITIEIRARDSWGNVDGTPASVLVDAEPSAGALETPLLADRSGTGAALRWGNAKGAVLYRVYRASSAAGPWNAVAETSGFEAFDGAADGAFYRVAPVDACGVEGGDR